MSKTLKEQIVGSCKLCSNGFLEGTVPCECLKRFRIYNRMIHGGFFKNSIDIVYGDNYQIPFIESGENFIDMFLKDPEKTEDKGRSLYIYSKDRGRGKTTLAHSIIKDVVTYFSDFDNYDSKRTYSFESVYDFQSSVDDYEHKYYSTWYVLDDLGNEESKPEWKKEKMVSGLQKMLQVRRNRYLPTIITSNYSPGELANRYDGVLNSLLEINPSGDLGGQFFRSIKVGGAEDLRLVLDQWEN